MPPLNLRYSLKLWIVFLKLIDNTTSKMTKKELEESIHRFARTLPEEQRDWFVSLISGKASKTKDSEQNAPHELYNHLESIISGEYRLDSEYNEMWDDWYDNEESEFVFEDNDGLLPIIQRACSELHRLVDSAEYNEVCRLGQILLNMEVQVDGDYSDYDENTLDLDDLECYWACFIFCKRRTFRHCLCWLLYMFRQRAYSRIVSGWNTF